LTTDRKTRSPLLRLSDALEVTITIGSSVDE